MECINQENTMVSNTELKINIPDDKEGRYVATIDIAKPCERYTS